MVGYERHRWLRFWNRCQIASGPLSRFIRCSPKASVYSTEKLRSGGSSILGFPSAYVRRFYERPTAYKVSQYTLREAYAKED
jgi:hypothetical protein